MRLVPLLAIACFTPPDLNLVDAVPIVGNDACAPSREVRVGCVLDGDTFDLGACGSGAERIRMLGVDAPEIAHDGNPPDCWGDEAADELWRVVADRQVTLSFDQECEGVFGRTLAYVWLPEGDIGLDPDDVVSTEGGAILVNELLLARGFARLYDEEWTADLRLDDRLRAAQAEAEARGLGLWSACPP
jgi:micrococcal nuclease